MCFPMDIRGPERYNGGKERGMPVFYTEQDSPVGALLMVSDGEKLLGLTIGGTPEPDWVREDNLGVFRQTRKWLEAYFRGVPAKAEELPLAPAGTPFQMRVWQILLDIPFGQIRTYGDIARQIGAEMGKKKMSAQAVGQAVGRNPIWIIIPCHRCMGAGNRLTGYAGGIEKKAWLLRHEGGNL